MQPQQTRRRHCCKCQLRMQGAVCLQRSSNPRDTPCKTERTFQATRTRDQRNTCTTRAPLRRLRKLTPLGTRRRR